MTKHTALTRLLHGDRSPLNEARQAGFIAPGCFSLFPGIVGAFPPVMPKTVFLIGAAWAFSRSSSRPERWMLDHPRFGPTLTAWRSSGAIPRPAKAAACTGINAGYAIFLLAARPSLSPGIVVFAVMSCVAVRIVRRPELAAVEPESGACSMTSEVGSALCDDGEPGEIPCG